MRTGTSGSESSTRHKRCSSTEVNIFSNGPHVEVPRPLLGFHSWRHFQSQPHIVSSATLNTSPYHNNPREELLDASQSPNCTTSFLCLYPRHGIATQIAASAFHPSRRSFFPSGGFLILPSTTTDIGGPSPTHLPSRSLSVCKVHDVSFRGYSFSSLFPSYLPSPICAKISLWLRCQQHAKLLRAGASRPLSSALHIGLHSASFMLTSSTSFIIFIRCGSSRYCHLFSARKLFSDHFPCASHKGLHSSSFIPTYHASFISFIRSHPYWCCRRSFSVLSSLSSWRLSAFLG
ncbi:hypothetical protein EJ06DRAFT_142319 [Trichodelitschia bisporula]|uniref:Uncharacterized protein n=1 Tax=Trichodelitschia bisporula TaxID=703511 RepID=A0A6G1HQ56_9PEZI|nr:hypothetical protein EJ06DRAFT_142319 [Trichodelitschia bisporula]